MACSVDDTATRPDQDHILAIRPGHARIGANEAQNKESSSFTERQGLPRAGQADSFHAAPNPASPANSMGGSPARFRFRLMMTARRLHRLDVEIEGLACEGASETVVGAEESADR
ncbi:hypothetical protein ACJKIH_11970 [Brucella pseudogrignonensis]|uniref:hypothetical protein n=1 Tax=Brucella pseudogrignonensis TaxID=419475 RepID=UPI0038B62C67